MAQMEERIMQAQSKLLKRVRKDFKLTQIKVAKDLKWDSQQFVSNIERGIAGFSIPIAKYLTKYVSKKEVIKAMLADYNETLEREL